MKTVFNFISIKKVSRIIRIFRTKLFWSWRLYHLGMRSVLDKKLLMSHPKSVWIGDKTTICKDFILEDLRPSVGSSPKIFIGNNCSILFRFQCNAAIYVKIGDNVLIASNVLISDSDHVVESKGAEVTINNKFISKPIIIGNNCWIGQNSVILKGVTIGDNSIVGANSVVNKNVESNSVVAGNPARLIKKI